MFKSKLQCFPAAYKALAAVKRRLRHLLGSMRHALIRLGHRWLYSFRLLRARDLRRAFLAHTNSERLRSSFFGQGLVTRYRGQSVWRWNWRHFRPTVLVLVNAERIDPTALADFRETIRRVLGARLHECSESWFRRGEQYRVPADLYAEFSRHDLIFLDGREPLPSVFALLQQKFALCNYTGHKRISLVLPRWVDEAGITRSVFIDRQARDWRVVASNEVRDYGQHLVPRYVLGGRFHGAYIHRRAVESILQSDNATSLDGLVNNWVRNVVSHGGRVLSYAPAAMTFRTELDRRVLGSTDWYLNRAGRIDAEKLRVIFVLPATTLSGGIRAVLEKAETMLASGLDVEVWSLQGNPDWTEVSYRVRKFPNYSALTNALSIEDALKVATWWETAEPVFLGSLQYGVPVQYVQEFESWFYPGDESAQAAVVSSYRPEFAYTTTASYQAQELAEIGIEAPIIPPAFDSKVFNVDASVQRSNDTLLAVGRTFFQKNFQLTANAWRSLGGRRPNLTLFGFEPSVLIDERVSYIVRPSDAAVADLYRSSTAFVQTSIHEGFSLPLMEAMACGCPVITTDSHGNRDFCVPEENCVLVPSDPESVAAAIERVMSNPELRQKLSIEGIKTARRYTWDRVAQETTAAYREVAREACR